MRVFCPMAALVEARESGRVGEHERPALDAHVAVCAECAELRRDLARLGELARRPVPPVPELERRRARLRLLREAAESSRRPRSRTIGIAVAAAAIAAALGFVELRDRAAPPAPTAAAPAVAPAPSAIAARAETRVRGEPGARFTRSDAAGADRVELESGTVEAAVRPLRAGERFVVATADAEVEVHGTVFRVTAEDRRLRGVEVREGKVEVRFEGRAFALVAGDAWTAPAAAPPVPSGEATASRAPATSAARAPSAAPAPRAPAASATPDDGAALFAEGVESLGRGDYEAAARRLAAFRKRAPGDPRAEDAAFLGVIALERAGRKAEAKDAARRYLADFPAGHRAAEARAIADAP